MTLSESAEKGKKLAGYASVSCLIAAVMSLLTLNVPAAAVGLWAAGGIKRGSLAARTMCIILRIADIPVLIIMGVMMYLGHLPTGGVLIAVLFQAFIDLDLLLSLGFDRNINAYFREINFDSE